MMMKKFFVMVAIGMLMICSCITVANAAVYVASTFEDANVAEEVSNGTEEKKLSEYTDEELLAYFINYEGGELHERLLVAESLLAGDSLGVPFRAVIYMSVSASCEPWKNSLERFDEINLELARIAIKNHESGNDTQYDSYRAKRIFFADDYEKVSGERLETEHYVFFSTEVPEIKKETEVLIEVK